MDASKILIDNTMGAAFIGVICAALLYGVSCTQIAYYYVQYPNDKLAFKILVTVVWTLDTIHQALISHTVYHYLVTHYAQPEALGALVWSVLLEVLFNAIIGLLVQCFLVLRLWKLSGENMIITISSLLVIGAGFACSVAFTIKALHLETWNDLGQLKGLSMSVNILTVVPDVLLALALTWYLHKSKTGFKRSNTIISRLIMFTVSTGVLTSICAIASFLSILIWDHTLVYVAFYFCLGRFYCNSLLATLNARSGIRGGMNATGELEFESFSHTAEQRSLPQYPSFPTDPAKANHHLAFGMSTSFGHDLEHRPVEIEVNVSKVVKDGVV